MKNLKLITQEILLSGHIRWAKNKAKNAFENISYFCSSYHITEIVMPISIKIEILNYKQIFSLNSPVKIRLFNQLTDELNAFYNINKTNNKKKIKNKFNKVIQSLKEAQISVITGYKRVLRVKGVGYKFNLNVEHQFITIEVGYSYFLQTRFDAEFSPSLYKKSTELEIRSNNLLKLTTFLSKVRKLRIPDVYKGKGIRYKKDFVRRKEGKKKKSF